MDNAVWAAGIHKKPGKTIAFWIQPFKSFNSNSLKFAKVEMPVQDKVYLASYTHHHESYLIDVSEYLPCCIQKYVPAERSRKI